VKPRREESLCRVIKPNGERCGSYADSSGYCSYHRDPARARAMAKAGGEARRKGLAERLPEAAVRTLRDVLREDLDPRVVLEAMRQALTGGNESARVAAVKFLADLEIYRRDEPKQPESEALVEQHDPADVLRKLWEIGAIGCPTCDGPLVKAADLDAVVPHFEQTPPVVRMELLDEGGGKLAGTSPAATGAQGAARRSGTAVRAAR
jgi:hypothetical protein